MLRRAGLAVVFLLAGVPLFAHQPPSSSAPPPSSQPSSTALSPTFKLGVMVIDDLHTDAGQAGRAIHVASQFIEHDLGAHDSMAVVHTIGSQNEKQTFTNDKSRLLAAVEKTNSLGDGSATLNELHGQDARSITALEVADARSAYLTLENVAGWLGKLSDHRKAILFVSQGIDEDIQAPGDAVQQAMRDAVEAATRNNVAIYGIDPRGLAFNRADLDIGEMSSHPSPAERGPVGAAEPSDHFE